MKRTNQLFIILFALLFAFTACDDDDTPSAAAGEDLNGLAVVLERTSDEDVEVSFGSFADEDVSIRFCYEGDGCEDASGGGTMSWGGPSSIMIEQSDPDKIAVGVIVGFQVESGEGYAEVVAGESYEDDGRPQFDEVDVVETSDPFSEGDIVEFSYGETTDN